MAIDTRDYYRDRIRKKAHYVERADFRVSEHEVSRRKYSRAWRGNWIKLGVFLALLFALIWINHGAKQRSVGNSSADPGAAELARLNISEEVAHVVGGYHLSHLT